ncbi:GNAT family N-acetyltransferase [Caldisalinibacter kiritimatiensis]|uniref:N-acetyltransferase domain-containing protein n=1 Tax=Caldisalinibacter kiritimatiensis TaxID=1304284 RepID=R1CWT8_9FIRM|nr:GNAT family N-acetyltransferase [Caldisalinibacter kiritimatiensis]EOD01089.1 hypothetical protein L21TH_0852 [Caldisalinibacter kiritimatiensis]
MIISRKVKDENELFEIKKILEEKGINDKFDNNQIVYILIENSKIIGVSKVTRHNNIGILNYVFVTKSKRGENLGDGLMRALFNHCLLNGIFNIYYSGVNDYLLKKGFKKMDKVNLNEDIKQILSKSQILSLNLNDFFSSGCCHS